MTYAGTSMFTIKQYNTVPSLEATLVDYLGQPVSLAGATIVFAMRSQNNQNLVIDGVAFIVDAAAGKVAYQWDQGDTNTDGAFIGEFQVTYPNGGKESFPNGDYIQIHVVRSAGNPN